MPPAGFARLGPRLLALAAGLGLQAQDLLPAEVRWSAERWQLPTAGERMDLVGLQVHRRLAAGGYAGFGGWGSLRGERGGFITLGLSGGWRWPLGERLALDLGGWFGGGGVGRAAVGGGMMLRGHAGLSWDARWARLGAEWSKVRFPNGRIDTSQWALTASIPFSMVLAEPDRPRATWTTFWTPTSARKMGWRGFSFALTGQRYAPRAGVKSLRGVTDTAPVDLVGLETRLDLGRGGAFAVLDMAAAARGKADGYMDTLLGLGYALPLGRDRAFNLVAKVAGGPAGGGDLDVGGGMAWKGGLGLEGLLPNGVLAGLSAGYIATPGGTFKGAVYQVQLGRRFEVAAPGGRSGSGGDAVDMSGWAFRGGWQRLSAAQRRNSATPEAIELISLQASHDLGGPWFLAGQGNFGLTGHAGGFAMGLLGLGLRSPALLGSGPRFRAQLMAGAAGGGGVDTNGGLVIEALAGLEQDLGSGLSLQLMAGRAQAPKGTLSTNVLDAGLVWRFGLPVRGRYRFAING